MACKHSEARWLSREEQLEWCGECGALYEDGEWQAPRRAAYIEPFGSVDPALSIAQLAQPGPSPEMRVTVMSGPILHWFR